MENVYIGGKFKMLIYKSLKEIRNMKTVFNKIGAGLKWYFKMTAQNFEYAYQVYYRVY